MGLSQISGVDGSSDMAAGFVTSGSEGPYDPEGDRREAEAPGKIDYHDRFAGRSPRHLLPQGPPHATGEGRARVSRHMAGFRHGRTKSAASTGQRPT